MEVGGLLQAGLVVELGLPSGKRGSKPCVWVGGACCRQTLSFVLMSHVEASTGNSLWFGGGERRGLVTPSPNTRKRDPYHPQGSGERGAGQMLCEGPALLTPVSVCLGLSVGV